MQIWRTTRVVEDVLIGFHEEEMRWIERTEN